MLMRRPTAMLFDLLAGDESFGRRGGGAGDPVRNVILLAAGEKRGANEDRFYLDLIQLNDSRFAGRLAT